MVKKSESKSKTPAKRQTKAKTKAKKKTPLVKVPEEYIFWCQNGSTFRDLKELAEGLAAMSDETFFHHANQEKNDFSNWVRDVINDMELATSLSQSSSKDQAVGCIVARLDCYE